MTLSKSQYIRALQCYKSIWLYKHRPNLKDEPYDKTKALFERGYKVGNLAKRLFPNGVEIEFDSGNFNGMIDKTKELIAYGTEVIYEATFKEDGIFAMADILVRDNDRWDIYEVKSATQIKDYHLNDMAIQWYALSKSIKLNKAYIVHINKEYVRDGELDIDELFTIEDITNEAIIRQKIIPKKLKEIEALLGGKEPQIDIGKHCFEPFECDFHSYCWDHIPKENSIFELSCRKDKQFEFYKEGVLRLEDIPKDEKLPKNALLQLKHYHSKEIKIEKKEIKDFLDTISYPINFFDFETFQSIIPRFDRQRPLEQVPFQYSLHILHEDGRLEHKEFLGDEDSDPREPLIKQMLADITPTGSIIAYNKSFEITQIKKLAKIFPSYKDELMALIDRFVDLAYPFQNKHYYHPNFKGKYSIKVVLPTLFPDDDELDYKKLGSIQNGSEAMDIFANLHLIEDKTKRDEMRRDLLAYCRLDTLAMVRIWEKLHELC